MKAIAIIPARSGSKGLPDKNIKEFCGIPLMAWTIKAALESDAFDEVMVSTDSEKYKEIAEQYGASVPFLRSKENSADKSSSWDAMREVINEYIHAGKKYDVFCMLQPTSPLRGAEEIKKAFDLFYEKKADSVVSLCKMDHSISICNRLPENNSLNGFFDSTISGRRQDMEVYYRINGAIYIQRIEELMKKSNLYGENSFAYVMDKVSSIDIDDEYDFIQAEAIAKYLVEKDNGIGIPQKKNVLE